MISVGNNCAIIYSMKKLMKICAWFFITSFTLTISTSWASLSPTDLLLKSDRARGGINDGLSWEVTIKTFQDGTEKESTYEVWAKKVDVLAKCLLPARQKGEIFLFNDKNLWVYRPNLKKPISVSSRQRLSGQTANGDIATTNYAKDYNAASIGKEVINGIKTDKLLLKAKSKDLTYDQIHYWVNLDTGLAIQAEFLTLEGKAFKKAVYKYENTIEVNGKKEPFISEILITDVAFPNNKSILNYSKLKKEKLNDGFFNVNNLSR